MPITSQSITYKLDMSTIGNRVVIPVAQFSMLSLQLEGTGVAWSAGVITMKRGNNGLAEFATWEAGAVTFAATGFYPATGVYNVAGFSHVSLEVTTIEAALTVIIHSYANDSLAFTKAL